MRYILPIIIFLAVGCGNGNGENGEQTIKDLERAITAIEDRQQAEYKIIEDQERMINIMEGNIDKANSEGMKDKIRNDINEKRVIIRDAEVNLRNQEKVLGELYAKRDSIMNK
ncbi:hypothetical protein O3Q51_06540 [Cryomorphaceae bacterium 1068]|nr:hypothetical protein [Cryomorphaceae bacterium 1068]